MPKGKFDTPGPFYGATDAGWKTRRFRRRGNNYANEYVAMVLLTHERDAMLSLLNKGTHFDEMLVALKETMMPLRGIAKDHWDLVVKKDKAIAGAKAAIAKADGERRWLTLGLTNAQ